ncbi:hypothetical protein HK102_009758 [Quaeritorhiza haematococci]|nr:hypothetical protein HK102_009758 [Quaeritorhiza haematococci]
MPSQLPEWRTTEPRPPTSNDGGDINAYDQIVQNWSASQAENKPLFFTALNTLEHQLLKRLFFDLLDAFYDPFSEVFDGILLDVPRTSAVFHNIRLHVTNVKLRLDNFVGISESVLEHLHRFPNLERLSLTAALSFETSVGRLFNHPITSLRRLSVTGYDCETVFGELLEWSWKCDTQSSNSGKAQKFFSHLEEIKFWNCGVRESQVKHTCLQLIDAAQQNLRVVQFPHYTHDGFATRFFARCSNALVAVRIYNGVLSEMTLKDFANRFEGLRSVSLGGRLHSSALDFLIRMRGRQLKCLRLRLAVASAEDGMTHQIMRSIITHCRFLECLELWFPGYSSSDNPHLLREDCLDLVRCCGPILCTLNLNIETNIGGFNNLIQLVSDCCPALESLALLKNLRLTDDPLERPRRTPFDLIDEDYDSGPEYDDESDDDMDESGNRPSELMRIARNMPGVTEEALRTLLDKCKHLRWLRFHGGFNCDRFADTILKDKVMCLDDEAGLLNFDPETNKYFDSSF